MKQVIKNIFGSLWRFILFFTIWVVIVSIIFEFVEKPSFLNESGSLIRLWSEFVPFMAIIATTLLFLSTAKRKIKPRVDKNLLNGALIGATIGIVWLGVVVLILLFLKILEFRAVVATSALGVWVIAAAINVAMQEYLVRGYLFQMLKSRYSVVVATIFTTVLFVAMHGFQGGFLGIINVTFASLLFTMLLTRTGTLVAPIVAHTVWNVGGGVILGVISLGGVYPHFMKTVFSGPKWLTGGNLLIEGSIITATISALLILLIIKILPKKIDR